MILIPIIISIVVAGWFYHKTIPELNAWQKNLLWFLRSCSLIIIMLLLFNPILSFFKNRTVQSKIIFLNDISESMDQVGEKISKKSTMEKFRATLRNKLVQKNYTVDEFEFSDGLDGSRKATYFGKSISQLLKNADLKNVEDIYLFSDGWFQDDNLDFLSKIDIPITTFEPEFKFVQSDLEINSINFPKTAYIDDITPFSVYLVARNFKQKAIIKLLSNGKMLQSQTIDFSNNVFQNITFEYSFATAGLHKLQVSVSADSLEETNLANNTISSAIQVLETRQKCLIISDALIWDIRFLKNALNSLPHWETDYLQKKKTLKRSDRTVRLLNEIKNVNTLVLVNNGKLNFTSAEAKIITNFISAGGGLLLMGKKISSIKKLLPSNELSLKQTFSGTIKFTEQSQRYQTFRSLNPASTTGMPPVEYYYVKPKLQAEILAEIVNPQNSPAILFMDFDKGKILQLPFYDLWKWQLRSAGQEYRKFMTDLIIWLGTMRSELFYAYTDKNSYYNSETIRINLAAYDETMKPRSDINARIKLFSQKDTNKPLLEKYLLNSNAGFYAEFDQLEVGEYSFVVEDEISQSKTNGSFIVQEDNIESRDSGFNYSLLDYISNQTDGKFFTESDLKNIEISQASSQIVTIKNEIPIYKKWYVITLFLICFCLELYLRKRWGLL